MKETNYFIFRCSNSRRKSGAYIFKVPQGEDEWNSEMRKDTEGENRKKKIFVCEIYYSEYQLIHTFCKSIFRDECVSQTKIFFRIFFRMSKFPHISQHDDPREHFERSTPSVNDHSAIFNILQKLCENGPSIPTISFRVTTFSCSY